MLICLVAFCSSCFAGEQEAVASFKSLTGNIVAEIQNNINEGGKVRYFAKGDYWFKHQKVNLKSAIDIHKTDSLISPYKGILELQADDVKYYSIGNDKGHYTNKEEAKGAGFPRIIPAITKTRFIYMYQNEVWVLKDVQYQFLDEYIWKQNDLKSPQEYFCVTEDN